MPIFFDVTHHHHTRVCNIWTHSAGSHLKSINDDVKKSIAILTYKQWLLSMDRKTKVVQHVPSINISIWHMTVKCDMWQHYSDSHFWAYTFCQKTSKLYNVH